MSKLYWHHDYATDCRVVTGKWVCVIPTVPIKYIMPSEGPQPLEFDKFDVDFRFAMSIDAMIQMDKADAAYAIYNAFVRYLDENGHDCANCRGLVFKALDQEVENKMSMSGTYGTLGGQQFASGGIISSKSTSFIADEYAATEMSVKSRQLPGINYRVQVCPADKEESTPSCHSFAGRTIWSLVQHLNDKHRWTREAIAEWLENIHDPTGENGPNLAFQIKEEA